MTDITMITRRKALVGIGASASALAISSRRLRAASFARGICYMEEFGFHADPVATATPYANGNADAYADIVGNSSRGDTLTLPSGFAMIHKEIPALKDYTQLVGRGPQSAIVRGFSQPDWSIFLAIGGQDSWARHITFYTCDGTSGGFCVGRSVPNENESLEHGGLDNIQTSKFNTGTWYGAAILDATNGPPNYGGRRMMVRDLMCGSATYIGLLLGGVNVVSCTGLVLGLGDPFPEWGLWCLGVDNNTCNEIYAEGPMNNTILLYQTNSSGFKAGSIASVTIDTWSASNIFMCGFLNTPPDPLGGINNILYAGQAVYKSG